MAHYSISRKLLDELTYHLSSFVNEYANPIWQSERKVSLRMVILGALSGIEAEMDAQRQDENDGNEREERCATCLHWCGEEPGIGECRRRSPRHLDIWDHAQWPQITGHGWCGEWEWNGPKVPPGGVVFTGPVKRE